MSRLSWRRSRPSWTTTSSRMWPRLEKHQQLLALMGRSVKLDDMNAAEPTELGWNRKEGHIGDDVPRMDTLLSREG